MWHNIYVKPKNKAEKEREGADRVAEIMYAALTKLPKIEQKDAVKAIQAIKINVNRSRSTSKRSSIPQSLRESSNGAATRRKRVRP
ncbi:MAG TPA: hypothetical protein VN037_03190 [Verrucomicrobiae bacterium]|nr:hypothetical protein [Verrucomicrobiae bacterium]